MKRKKTVRALGMESLESRIALASESFVTITVTQFEFVGYKLVARQTATFKIKLENHQDMPPAEGEGGRDAPRISIPTNTLQDQRTTIESGVPPNKVSPASVATPSGTLGSSASIQKPLPSVTAPDRINNQPIFAGPAGSNTLDASRNNSIQRSPASAPLGSSASAISESKGAAMSPQVSTHHSQRAMHDVHSHTIRSSHYPISASTLQSRVAVRKQPDATSRTILNEALQFRNRSQRELSKPTITSLSEDSLLSKVIAKPMLRSIEDLESAGADRMLFFSRYDSEVQSLSTNEPSGWEQLPTLVGVVRSWDGITEHRPGPSSELTREALLQVVAEFESGEERSEESLKESDQRGMSTAGSVLVATYAVMVARRKRKHRKPYGM